MTKNRLNIKRSEFLSFVEQIRNVDELNNVIKSYKKHYSDARHVCWGAIIDDIEFSSDASEPRGTAGIHILSQIKSHNMKNI